MPPCWGAQGIISQAEAGQLIDGLQGILSDLESGALEFDFGCEDIHMFVEQVLTQRLGDVGKKLHTARSRNDQVALDLRMYLKDQIDEITALVKDVLGAIVAQAENNKGVIMPGYTHLQRAQPILFSHHLMAYAMMLLVGSRPSGRLPEADECLSHRLLRLPERRIPPTGAFERGSWLRRYRPQPIDGVSDRDFCGADERRFHTHDAPEPVFRGDHPLGKLGIQVHRAVRRLHHRLVHHAPEEEPRHGGALSEARRPALRRPDGAAQYPESGCPGLANKAMQEDKEAVFDAVDTVKMCLKVLCPMLSTMTVKAETMKSAAQGGFINATDLVGLSGEKGVSFRSAYKISGQIVARCIADGCVLETLSLETYRSYSELLLTNDLYHDIDLTVCVEKRIPSGGTSAASVDAQIAYEKGQLGEGNV